MRLLRTALVLAMLCSPAWGPHAAAVVPVAAPARSPLVETANGHMVAPDIARIVNQGELVIATLATDTAPFFFVESGVLVGTDVDLAKRIGKELGVVVRFDRSAKTFDGVVEAVAAGRADLGISKLDRTLKRSQMVHFSIPYMRLGHALLINRVRFAAIAGDRPLPQVIRSFSGTIGVIAGSSWEESGRQNFPHAKLVSFPTWPNAVAAAKAGTVVAAYRDELAVLQIVHGDPGLALSLRTVTFNDLESRLSVMVGIRDPTLLSFVNEVITQWAEKPTVSSVLKPIK